ncbi:MFS transporter [Nocardioides cavernae]|uniref:MFS transporter n=1 Tax=Nocardioides cavernae TaxID=1921566 RepID=A0ABR8NC67_9ACTN|nr:MFS transporter [Nocardioides cavernae]MBD3924464.1 MFS transporter [Nocardioides cavernae]MBM7510590.1 DHA2 family methylenomycin A resistance protein-like MFS transporter [Nocardioides cavernae]
MPSATHSVTIPELSDRAPDAVAEGRAPSTVRLDHLAPLGVAMLGFFVVALDAQIVNVALPDISASLGGGLSGLQWVVTGYTLTFSSLLLFSGTLSDRVGARHGYGLGMGIFVLASVACGFAPSLPALVAARVAQGVGAALITPTSLALVREAYEDSRQRARAIAYWALGGSVAAAAGPVLGGVLTEIDWRIIFYLNLPVGLLALALLSRVPASPRTANPFDAVGQATALVALVGLTYAVIEGGGRSYHDADVVAAFGVAALGAIGFAVSQARGRHPMVPLDLFRTRPVAISLAAAFLTMAAFYGVVFVQSLYFQQVRGASPLETGLLFLPMTGLVAALNPTAAKVALRFGSRVPIIGGQVLMVVGLLGLALAPADLPLWAVAALMVPVGVGGSFTVPPLTSLLLESVPAPRAGTASGVLNTARQVGGSMGVAAAGAVIAHLAGFMDGLRVSLVALAALVAVTTALSLLLPHGKDLSS